MKKNEVISLLILLLWFFLYACTNTSSDNKEKLLNDTVENEEVVVQMIPDQSSSSIAEPDEMSIDLDYIKNSTQAIDEFSGEIIDINTLVKVDTTFIVNFLSDYKLPYFMDLVDPFKLNYYFYSHHQSRHCFYFTIFANNDYFPYQKMYLITIDYQHGHVQDCQPLAELSSVEGYKENYSGVYENGIFKMKKLNIGRNVAEKLLYVSQDLIFNVNEKLKIQKEALNKVKTLGRADALLIEYYFLLTIPNMYVSGEEDLAINNPLYTSYSTVYASDTINYTMAGLWGISGELFGNKILIENDGPPTIVFESIKMAYSNGIYFNEDGSGGTWGGGDSPLSEWIECEKVSEYEFNLPEKDDFTDPQPSDDDINEAEAKVSENSMLSYYIWQSLALIELNFLVDGEPETKVIQFSYEYGD